MPNSLMQRSSSSTQLADPDEIFRVELADPMDQLVADLRPFQADAEVADMVPHAHGARREDHQVGVALALELELGALQSLPDLVVADLERRPRGHFRAVLDGGDLLLPEPAEIFLLGW